MVGRRFFFDRMDTPTGEMTVACDEEGRLCALEWESHRDRLARLLDCYHGAGRWELEPARNPFGLTAAVEAYMAGDIEALAALPVADHGTAFQRAVWAELRRIPAGTTISYGELARRIGKPAAVRAVGMANGANPVAIAVPCHRVIGASGKLTGYGGGLERKHWLLAHERAQLV